MPLNSKIIRWACWSPAVSVHATHNNNVTTAFFIVLMVLMAQRYK